MSLAGAGGVLRLHGILTPKRWDLFPQDIQKLLIDHCYKPPRRTMNHHETTSTGDGPWSTSWSTSWSTHHLHLQASLPSCWSHTHENQQKELASHKGMIIESRPWEFTGIHGHCYYLLLLAGKLPFVRNSGGVINVQRTKHQTT